MSPSIERRLSGAIVVAATAIFAILLVVLPSYFPTFDEAKYLGIGVDIWSGHGITTVFGISFTSHAPAWPAMIALPQALFGFDALTFGRILDAISGTAIVALTGAIGWRIRPVVGAIAASGLLALVYLHDLTRTARLDVPASALLLLYLYVAYIAFRRRSVRLGLVAGLVFAGGFLVKEIDLPFAPAPLFAAILWGVPWRSLGRTGAAMLAVAAAGIAPWFVYYAATVHRVYRLDAPAWVLVPMAIAVVILVVLGLLSDRIADGRVGARIGAVAARFGADGRLRTIVAWGLTLVWSVALTYAFAKTARLTGTTFLGLDQLRLYAETWFGAFRSVAIFGVAGIVFAIAALRLEPGLPGAQTIRDLLIATICGIPLILLVIAVGEPPRNYLANIALVTVIAAAGWGWALERLLRTSRTVLLVGGATLVGAAGGVVLAGLAGGHTAVLTAAGAAFGGVVAAVAVTLERRGLLIRPLVVPGVALAALFGGTGLLGAHGLNSLHPAGGEARSQAVDTEVAWIRANIPKGTMIAYGSFLAYETAYHLAVDYGTAEIRARISTLSLTAPDGLIRSGEQPADDWISVDNAPRNVDQFQAYRATWLQTSFTRKNATYWVYTTGIDTSSPTIEAALTTATGFEKVIEWTFPVVGATPLHTSIYKVDPAKIGFDTTRLVTAPDALARIVHLLSTHGADGTAAAGRLLAEVEVQPVGSDADAAMAALKALAGR